MKLRRIFSFFLALMMLFSSFAELIPANAFASEAEEETQTAETEESTGEIVASYDIPIQNVGISEDGGFIIELPEMPSISVEETEESAPAAETTIPAVTVEEIPEMTQEQSSEETVSPETEETEPSEPEETVIAETEETVPSETEETVPVQTEETVPAETEETVPSETEETVPEETAMTEPLTWFQWIEEMGIDGESLTKETKGELFGQYSAYRINALEEMGELSDGAGYYGKINNDYIEFAVREDGRFTIGNRIGNPGYDSDDYEILLYGHDQPWSSETLIYLDGEYSNLFTASSTSYNKSTKTATATMTIPGYNIKVTQTLKLVKTGTADFEDTVQIQYSVKNNDSKSHKVGIRIMMDTMLANNDDATFRVESVGNIVKDREFTGSNIPGMYQVYDNLDNPTTLATGYLYRGSDKKPNKVQFCNWGRIQGSSWDHQIQPDQYLGDSAVGIYFNPESISAGGSRTVRTYYGVSISSGGGNNSTVEDKMVNIQIQDSVTKKPLAGVEVSYIKNGTTVTSTTSDDGYVILESGAAATLTLKKDGYKTTTVECPMTAYSCFLYKMSTAVSKAPLITSIMLDTGTACADLMNGSATYYEDSDNRIKFSGKTGAVKIVVGSDSKNCTYQLLEDGVVIRENKTGTFSFDVRKEGTKTYIESFRANGKRQIRCISSDGSASQELKFNLKIKQDEGELAIDYLDARDIIPDIKSNFGKRSLAKLFFGDSTEFKLGDSDLAFKVDVADDGSVFVGLNIDPDEWSNLSRYHNKKKERLDDAWKKALNGDRSDLDNFFAKRSKYRFTQLEAEFNIMGYGTGTMKNGNVTVNLRVIAELSGGSSKTVHYLTGAIPTYIYVKGEVGAQLDVSGTLITDTAKPRLVFENKKITPKFTLTVAGGFGVKGCVSVGAEGKAVAELILDLMQKRQMLTLTGTVYITAEVLLWSRKDKLAETDPLVIYDSLNKEGTVYCEDDDIFAGLEAKPYQLKPRESTNAEGGSSSGVTDVRLLDVGGTQYKFFVADRGGNLSNRNMLSYSVMRDGTWTDSVPVADDGTSDFYYDIATDGNDIYVVWSNCNEIFDDETVTADQMAGSLEICYAVIGADGTISEPVRLTDNREMDVMPAVTLAEGVAYVAWSHTANGVEFDTDVYDNYLYYTTVTNGTVGDVQISNRGSNSINSVSASTIAGKPVATFVTNGSDEITFEENVTHEVVMSSGAISTIDKNETVVGKAVTARIDGAEQVFWMENGNIAYADSMTAEAPSYVFTEETVPGSITLQNYTVITVGDSTYLIWTEADEDGANAAMTSIYSGGIWSAVHKLTQLAPGSIRALDGYQNAEGKLVLTYSAEKLCDNGNGEEDFVTTALEKVVEAERTVSVTAVEFEKSQAVPGQNLPMTLHLSNTGNTAITTLNVAIDSEAGEEGYTAQLNVNIGPGCDAQVQVTDFVLSGSLTTRTVEEGQYVYTVSVNAEDSPVIARKTFEIGYDNVYLYKRDTVLMDNRENIVIDVVNDSGFPASNVHVRILADAIDGVLIYDNVFPSIAGNGQVTVYLDVEELSSNSLYATVSTDGDPWAEAEYTELILRNPITVSRLTVDAYGCGTVSPEGTVNVNVGETVLISAEPAPGYLFDGWYSNRDLTWVSGNETTPYAQLQMPEGNTTVTARFVSQQAYDFTLEPESAQLYAGETLEMNARFASEEETGKVFWGSSDETVATVSDRGVVTALAEGTAYIVASCGEYSHQCRIDVSYVDISEIHMIYPQLNVPLGETVAVDVLTDPENGEASLIWSSSDESVATVDASGTVTTVGRGSAVITAAARTDSSVTAQCTVNVIVPVTEILLDNMEMELTLTENVGQLNVIYDPEEADFGKNISWSVDVPGVLEITSSGEFNEHLTVTALNSGTANVTAKTENGLEASCTVSVRQIVYASSVEELQSQHYPYESKADCTWIYTDESKDVLFVHFSDETALHPDDNLIIMDGEGNAVESGRGEDFRNNWIMVEDSTIQIQLISGDDTEGYYGFCVDEITDIITADKFRLAMEYNVEYTGKAVEPYLDVMLGNTSLERGADYTVKYSNNKNVGVATVQITGRGRYDGIVLTNTFRIIPGGTQLDANVSDKGIVLSWAPSKGAGGYYLYRAEDGMPTELYRTLGSSAKSFVDTGADKNRAYSYALVPFKNVRINGVNESFESWWSWAGPIIRLGPVTGLEVQTNQEGNIAQTPYDAVLTWNALEGAEGYAVYESWNDNEYDRRAITEGTSLEIYGMWSNGRYNYKVVPFVYLDGYRYEGGASNVVSTVGMQAPSVGCWRNQKGLCLEYYFDYAPDISSVEIYRSENNGAFKKWKTVKMADGENYGTLIDTGAKKSGVYYQYQVRTVMVNGKKTVYSPWSETVGSMVLGDGAISSVKLGQNGMEVSWKPVAGAQRYLLTRYFFDGEGLAEETRHWYNVDDPKAKLHTYVDTDSSLAGVYQYSVQAFAEQNGTSYNGGFANNMSGYVLRAPEIQYLANALKGTELNWEWDIFTNNFEVWRSADGGKWTKVKAVTGNWLSDTGASKDGVTYSYKVRAYLKEKSGTFYSDFSPELSIVKMTPPKVKTVKALPEGGFQITFEAVKNAERYTVNGMIADGDIYLHEEFRLDPKVKTYTVTDTAATAKNQRYCYELTTQRVVNGEISWASNWVYACNFGAPEVHVENSEKGIRITAQPPAEFVDSYTIHRSEDGGVKWKKLKTVKADSNVGTLFYEDTSAKNGKTYQYRVECSSSFYNASTSTLSDPISCHCIVGPKIGKVTNVQNGVTVTWTAQKDMPAAESYVIYRGLDNCRFEQVGIVSGDTFSFTDDIYNLNNVELYYKVGVIPAGKAEPVAYSAVQKTVYLAAPYNLQVYWLDDKNADVVWNSDSWCEGTEIRLTTDNSVKTINVKDGWEYYSLSGLRAGTVYCVSIRTYYTQNKVKYYSGWSDPIYFWR